MDSIVTIILYSFASGVTIIIGGLLARLNIFAKGRLHSEMSRGIIAFGGGVLVAAVAFVLAPRGIKSLSFLPLIVIFLIGH